MSKNEVKRVGPKNSKGNRVCIYGGLGLLIGGLILLAITKGIADGDSATLFFVIGGILVIFGVALAVGGVLETRHYHRTHCKQCGHLLDVTDTNYEGSDVTGDNNTGTAKRKEAVSFDCKCPNCGLETSFTEHFTTGTVDKNGNVHERDLDTLVKRFWKYKK
jgi:hypothetical protein